MKGDYSLHIGQRDGLRPRLGRDGSGPVIIRGDQGGVSSCWKPISKIEVLILVKKFEGHVYVYNGNDWDLDPYWIDFSKKEELC